MNIKQGLTAEDVILMQVVKELLLTDKLNYSELINSINTKLNLSSDESIRNTCSSLISEVWISQNQYSVKTLTGPLVSKQNKPLKLEDCHLTKKH